MLESLTSIEDYIMALQLRTSTKFSLEIEKLSKKENLPYMESVILYCTKEGLELEQVGKLVNTSLKEKIQLEAQNLNYMPKTASLPLG